MRARLNLAILLGITCLVFGTTLLFPFIGDDIPQILQNPRVQSWSYLPKYFTQHLWMQIPGAAPRYYRPLFLLGLRCMHAVFGMWIPGWHIVLLLSHLGAVAAVYWFIRQWKDERLALLTAALFALHPVHAEVVSWVSAIAEPWLAICLIASLVLAQRKNQWSVMGAWALFAVALLLKETAIILPVLIFVALYDDFPSSIRRTMPFAVIAAAYLALRIAVLGSLSTPLVRAHPASASYVPTAFTYYMLHLVWPVGLSTYCNLHPTWAYLAFVLPLLALACWVAMRGKYERTAIALILVPLLPTLNYNSLPLDYLVQDRYLYIPSIGFVMLLAALLQRVPKPATVALLAAMVVGCFYETRTWSDGEHFYARGLEIAPDNADARSGLGRIYTDGGKYREAIQVLEPLVQKRKCSPDVLQQSLLMIAYDEEQLGNVPAALQYYVDANSIQRNVRVERHILELQSGMRSNQ